MTALAWFGFSSLAFAIIWIGVFATFDWFQRRQWQRPPDTCLCGATTLDDDDLVAWRLGPERHSRDRCDFPK